MGRTPSHLALLSSTGQKSPGPRASRCKTSGGRGKGRTRAGDTELRADHRDRFSDTTKPAVTITGGAVSPGCKLSPSPFSECFFSEKPGSLKSQTTGHFAVCCISVNLKDSSPAWGIDVTHTQKKQPRFPTQEGSLSWVSGRGNLHLSELPKERGLGSSWHGRPFPALLRAHQSMASPGLHLDSTLQNRSIFPLCWMGTTLL